MFPYKDENPTLKPPFVTVVFIVLNTLAWLLLQGAGSEVPLARSVCELGAIPGELLGRVSPGTSIPVGRNLACELSGDSRWYTVITSAFMHGGWFHLIGNMWFLWVFGNNIEDSMGHVRFVGFYLLCGVVAALAQVMANPNSAIPMVGASGAVSGIMGAYLVLYPRVRVHLFVFLGFIVTTIVVPAYLMLFYWAFLQVLGGLPALADAPETGGVAFMAHLGGFIAGAALIKIFARPDLVEEHRRYIRQARAAPGWQSGTWR